MKKGLKVEIQHGRAGKKSGCVSEVEMMVTIPGQKKCRAFLQARKTSNRWGYTMTDTSIFTPGTKQKPMPMEREDVEFWMATAAQFAKSLCTAVERTGIDL